MKKPITIIIFSILFWFIQSSLPSYAKTVPGISGINKTGFCCINATLLSNKTKRQCDQLKGVYYSIGQKNKARKACQAEEGFCCVKGKLLSKKNKKECKQLRGKYYSPKLIKQAKLNCRREKGFCCVKGKLQVKKSEKECKKLRGIFYPKEDSAQAKRTCQLKKGFCCVKGRLQARKSEKECRKWRGTFFPKEDSAQAKRTCLPEKGFCCVKGSLQARKSEKECSKLRGKFYPKKDRSQARRGCSQKENNFPNKKVSSSHDRSQLKKNTFSTRKKETAKNRYGAKKFGNNQIAFSADKVIGKRNFQNFKGAKPSIGNAKKQKIRVLSANEKLNPAKFRGKEIAKQSPSDNKLRPKGFIGKSIDPGSLIYRKLKTHKLIKSGPSSAFKEKTVEIKKNIRETLGNITKTIFVNQEKFQKVLLKIKPSSGILTKPPVQKNKTYEFDDSFLIVKSTGIVVSDPRKLAEKSPQFRDFLGSKNKNEIIFSKLNSESQAGLINLMKNELPKRPKDDPLRIAANKGGMKGLLSAIAEGKGKFELTEEIVIEKKPPPADDGMPQSIGNIISHSKFPKDILSGRGSDFIINVPTQSGSTSPHNPTWITKGHLTKHFKAQFMTGFTLKSYPHYQRTWKFRGGLFRVMMEAGYTLGLRFPVEVQGEVRPDWIKVTGPNDVPVSFETNIAAKTINGDCSFYKNTGLTGESTSTCGKELALDFYYGYGLKFRALYTTVVDIPLHREHTPPWSQDFTPPFNNGGGPTFWIPADITNSKLNLIALKGSIQGGFKLSGTGTIHFDYEIIHGNKISDSREVAFTNPSPVRISNTLEPMYLSSDNVQASESYGFKLYNPEYKIKPTLTPGIKMSIAAGYKSFSRHFSCHTWLNRMTILFLPITFTRHRGTNAEFSWQGGHKFFEKN